MKALRSYHILGFTGVLLALAILFSARLQTFSVDQLTEKGNAAISDKYTELQSLATNALTNSPEKSIELYNQGGPGIYVFRNKALSFWNNSQIPLNGTFKAEYTEPLVVLRNGYYLAYLLNKDTVQVLVLTPIKTRYDLQNEYLKNSFAKWLPIPDEVDVSISKQSAHPMKLNGKVLFWLQGYESSYISKTAANTLSWLCILAFGILLLTTISMLKYPKLLLWNSLFTLLLLALRLVMIHFKWPSFLYDSELYDLRVFGNAQSYFNSYLGDILLNSITLVWLSIVVYYHSKNVSVQLFKIILGGLTVILILINLQFHFHITNSIISNSVLSFDFLNLFQLSWMSYVALSPIILSSISVLLLLLNLSSNIFYNSDKKSIIYVGIVFAINIALTFALPYQYWLEKWWFFPVALLLLLITNLRSYKNILALGTLLLIMALINSSILNFYINKNQKQDFELLSYKLAERQDMVLENEFIELPKKISSNQQLLNLSQFIEFNGDKEFLQLLRQNFFFGYFDRYNIEFSMFDEDCNPLIKNTQPILLNEGFFEEQIRYQSLETASKELFFIDQYHNSTRYIARIPVGKYKLYILLEPKFFEEVGAFPDLLIDESQQKQNKLRNLSYAVYRSGINNSMYGDVNYPVTLKDTTKLSGAIGIYKHHFLYPDENSTIVISTKQKNFGYYFTYNSYLFLYFSMIAYAGFILYSLLISKRLIGNSLTRRIQTTVILLLLLSIAAVGITSTKLVSDQFDKENEKELQEKSNTILSELSGLLQKSDTLADVTKDLLDLTIKKYAYVFNSEISLFNSSGELYITSQPRLYDLGLTAPLINAEAFYNLKNDLSSSYCSRDRAGKLNYLSLYAPIYNSNKKLLGYLNLPYFGKQSVLITELSGIMSTLINVYVILFIISILSGLILAGYITSPLRILKQQMAKVSLGKKNEAIQWNSDDEVGTLVSEYNSMIEKLDKSAGLLAKSERETAWREMAKQVAHEIKNPLTPMKLNLQYLQHVIKNNPDDFEERFTKASNNIIEQIDTLANIATEFSNFAKLPSGELEKIDLAEIIHSTADLFAKEENVKINVNCHAPHIYILADKEQMLRVFNNLLKNAIQATCDKELPQITVTTKENDTSIVVQVEDNGCGIPEGLKQNIFTPNFTTKSTGSGLGLAMIKNILETINARIWFESEENKGTIFYLEFNRIND